MRTEPRYEVVVLQAAVDDARKFLSQVQYAHAVSLVRRLVWFGDAKKIADLDIRRLDRKLWELRDKGGVLGRLNLRVFFSVLSDEVVVLKTYKKEEDGQTPRHVKLLCHDRLEDYGRGLARVFIRYPRSA